MTGTSDYVEAINNSVYINNARDNNGNYNGVVKYNIRFKIIITESYKWNNVGNVISSESYGSIDRHKDMLVVVNNIYIYLVHQI